MHTELKNIDKSLESPFDQAASLLGRKWFRTCVDRVGKGSGTWTKQLP